MEHKKKLYLAIGITLLIVLAFVGTMTKMIIENGKCVDSPFEYSAQRLEESGGMYMCGCQSLDPELLDFSFNSDGITINQPLNNYEINMDNIIVEAG